MSIRQPNKLMRFVGGPWDGKTKNSGDVHITPEGRVIVREAYLPTLDFAAVARGEYEESTVPTHIQTEYARWGDGTWRIKAIDSPVVGRREYDVPPEPQGRRKLKSVPLKRTTAWT